MNIFNRFGLIQNRFKISLTQSETVFFGAGTGADPVDSGVRREIIQVIRVLRAIKKYRLERSVVYLMQPEQHLKVSFQKTSLSVKNLPLISSR